MVLRKNVRKTKRKPKLMLPKPVRRTMFPRKKISREKSNTPSVHERSISVPKVGLKRHSRSKRFQLDNLEVSRDKKKVEMFHRLKRSMLPHLFLTLLLQSPEAFKKLNLMLNQKVDRAA